MNESKQIAISLFRVSADSKYLDMIFSCTDDYYFDSLELEVRYYDPSDKIMKSKYFDLSSAIGFEDHTQKRWVVRVPLVKLGIEVPAIYKGTLKIKPIQEGAEAPDPEYMVCSDVNYAYTCMLKDLLDLDNLADPCAQISDEAIRKYLLLYGHQSALSVGDDEVAERFFKLIINCFDLCGKSCSCSCGRQESKSKSSCNCGK